jgi:hypothetical protein
MQIEIAKIRKNQGLFVDGRGIYYKSRTIEANRRKTSG